MKMYFFNSIKKKFSCHTCIIIIFEGGCCMYNGHHDSQIYLFEWKKNSQNYIKTEWGHHLWIKIMMMMMMTFYILNSNRLRCFDDDNDVEKFVFSELFNVKIWQLIFGLVWIGYPQSLCVGDGKNAKKISQKSCFVLFDFNWMRNVF